MRDALFADRRRHDILIGALAAIALFVRVSGAEVPATLTVDVDRLGAPISPTLYGIFFEEINHAGEGGLYAEMVQNRDFEINTLPAGATWAGNLLKTREGWQERKWFGNELHGWSMVNRGDARGSIQQSRLNPLNERNPHSLNLDIRDFGKGIGIANGGFWGMNVQAGKEYALSFFARTWNGQKCGIEARLESVNGRETYSVVQAGEVDGEWRNYRCRLRASASDPAARLVLMVDRPDGKPTGSVWFDVVSLFPCDTYKNRSNGLRPDLVRMLAELKPAFVRFPGGAIVGGLNLDNRIQWKNSIGPIEQRVGTMNLWGYWTSNGLGFHEYLQLCEDIGADALWVCNPGFSDNYRRAEYAKPEDVPKFVAEAMDALEYALGPTNSTWGGKRAINGHPEPFRLKYVEIGNEAGGAVYRDNYRQFHQAIRAKYPTLKIISNVAFKDDTPVEIVDHHIYGSPDRFFEAHDQYDKADRQGPRIYVGEYGCRDTVGQGNLLGALSEAAYLMGLERNGDVVIMSSYAPLFFHVNDIAWPVNLIGFDGSRTFGRTSYHVQKMMAHSRPDVNLATSFEVSGSTVGPDAAVKPRIFVQAGLDKARGTVIVKAVNVTGDGVRARIVLRGAAAGACEAATISGHPESENNIDEPELIVPRTSSRPAGRENLSVLFPPWSFTVMRIGIDRKSP